MKVKKYIEIPEEILFALAEGRYVEGSLHRDADSCRLVFNVYNRKPRKRLKDTLIRYPEHGWVKESRDRIKIYESIPKIVGTVRMIGVIDRETKEIKNALMTRDVIDGV